MAKIRLATFDAAPSLALASRIRDRLTTIHGAPTVEIAPIDSSRIQAGEAEVLFEKLRSAEADVGVVPAQELPHLLPRGIAMAAVVRDRPAQYLVMSRHRPVLSLLPGGSKVVAGDEVVRAQILHRFPWLWVELAPADEDLCLGLCRGLWDAGCVPQETGPCCAGESLHSQPISFETLLPPVGQGCAALLARGGQAKTIAWLAAAGDKEAEICLRAERTFLRRASEGTEGMATARAVLSGNVLELTGLLVDRDGAWIITDQASAPVGFLEAASMDLADACRDGAKEHRLDPIAAARASLRA